MHPKEPALRLPLLLVLLVFGVPVAPLATAAEAGPDNDQDATTTPLQGTPEESQAHAQGRWTECRGDPHRPGHDMCRECQGTRWGSKNCGDWRSNPCRVALDAPLP